MIEARQHDTVQVTWKRKCSLTVTRQLQMQRMIDNWKTAWQSQLIYYALPTWHRGQRKGYITAEIQIWWYCMVTTVCWLFRNGHWAGSQLWQHSDDTNECTEHQYHEQPVNISTKHSSTVSVSTVSTWPSHVAYKQYPLHHVPRYSTRAIPPWTCEISCKHYLSMGLVRVPIQYTLCWPSSLAREQKPTVYKAP